MTKTQNSWFDSHQLAFRQKSNTCISMQRIQKLVTFLGLNFELLLHQTLEFIFEVLSI